ncbi:IS3 family transposase [Streptomyces sp. NPDC056708]|uniref:IS3 family transposase n=1 Tax=unclassified Streptomyces TaxID=2593676 RepID=UPI003676452F
MKTARSSYYAWAAGLEVREARRRADMALAHEITVIHIASKGTYGVPRVSAELRRQGRPVNRKCRPPHARARHRRPHPAHRTPQPDQAGPRSRPGPRPDRP